MILQPKRRSWRSTETQLQSTRRRYNSRNEFTVYERQRCGPLYRLQNDVAIYLSISYPCSLAMLVSVERSFHSFLVVCQLSVRRDCSWMLFQTLNDEIYTWTTCSVAWLRKFRSSFNREFSQNPLRGSDCDNTNGL